MEKEIIDRNPTLEVVIEVIQNAMDVAQKVNQTYITAIDFLESKGFRQEFEEYYKEKFSEKVGE